MTYDIVSWKEQLDFNRAHNQLEGKPIEELEGIITEASHIYKQNPELFEEKYIEEQFRQFIIFDRYRHTKKGHQLRAALSKVSEEKGAEYAHNLLDIKIEQPSIWTKVKEYFHN